MTVRCRLEDLPPSARAQAEEQLGVAVSSTRKTVGKTAAQRGGRTRGRQKGMNDLEKDYLARLCLQVAAGEVEHVEPHESIRLTLADRCTLAPDFPVWTVAGRLEFHEVKAAWIAKDGKVRTGYEEDARVKLKVAARQFQRFRFVVARRVHGAWQFEEIRP